MKETKYKSDVLLSISTCIFSFFRKIAKKVKNTLEPHLGALGGLFEVGISCKFYQNPGISQFGSISEWLTHVQIVKKYPQCAPRWSKTPEIKRYDNAVVVKKNRDQKFCLRRILHKRKKK